MRNEKVYDTPSSVGADKGEVIVTGPDSLAISLTPEAAIVTAGRLIEKAAEARGLRDIDADSVKRR